MTGGQFEKTVDRFHSKRGFPSGPQSMPRNSLVDESKRNRKPACLRFGNPHDSDREAITFCKVAIVSLMFLEKGVITTCDRSDQQKCKGTGHGRGDSLLASLRRFSGAQAISFGTRFTC